MRASLLWPLLLLSSATVEGSNGNRNPLVIQLTFRNDSGPTADSHDRLLTRTDDCGEDQPLVYCRDAEYPDDIYCDIGMLLEQDVFPTNMLIFGASTAVPDPVRAGRFCVLEFLNSNEKSVKPLRFQDIECGSYREITSEESLTAPDVNDSMTVLPSFKVADMSDLVLTSYSGFGCRHRLKRHPSAETKFPVSGSIFKLDSFFCSIGFGVASGRPEMPYPPQYLYKHDGKRWRPVGNWPDYV